MSPSVKVDAAYLRTLANKLHATGEPLVASELMQIAGRAEYNEQWWTAFATDLNTRSTDALRRLGPQPESFVGTPV